MTNEGTAHVGVLYVDLFIPEAQSLKEKRWVLKSIKARIRGKFNLSVAEIGGMDKWQKSILGFCVIGNDRRYINGTLDSLLLFLESVTQVQILNHQMEFF